jgi:methionyl-tRNA formyltransferase
MAARPRALFLGTPEFAVLSLKALTEVADVTLVVTQPDRPKGRGMKLAPPPVKVLAQELGLRVVQPTKIRTPEFAESLRAEQADVALVVAYGRILPPAVLTAPRIGCLNVHASLLPKLRGAAPIQWAIVRGEHTTGVCLMGVDEGLDMGPIYARASLDIGQDETSAELSVRLSELGAEVVRSELPRVLSGELRAVPQDHAAATHAPILTKQDGAVDWTQPARLVHDLVRGFAPWPSAFSQLDNLRLKLHRTLVLPQAARGEPGVITGVSKDGIDVACGEGTLRVLELQRDGARRMTAGEFVVGQRVETGQRFETPAADGGGTAAD